LIARPAGRGYAAPVSRLHIHRWAAIFLLVSKLILGQFVHAMPSTAEPALTMNDIATSVGHDAPPCGDHAQADDHASKSCCKGGECACPCLHSPAAAAVVSFIVQSAHDDRAATHIDGAAWHRLSALFRPPA
jgi:hypothetical protein